MDCKTVNVRIEGRVQGVWFRNWTKNEAQARGLDGWVRNRSDDSVEALFSGPKEKVDDMLEACWKGPPLARVDNVAASNAPPPAEAGFKTLPTE